MGKDRSKAQLPKVSENALTGHLGEITVDKALTEMGFIFHNQTKTDFGIDGIIEVTVNTSSDEREATGRQIAVQIKRGDKVVSPTADGYTLYCTNAHANYWLGHSLPVVVIYSKPGTDRLHWVHVTKKSLRSTAKGFAIKIPQKSDLKLAARELQKIAMPGTGSTTGSSAILLLSFDETRGLSIPNEELGLACLEFARSARRDPHRSIEVEMIGQVELIASIETIRTTLQPTPEKRRDALIRESILDRYENTSLRLKRAFTWLLTDQALSRFIGFDYAQLGKAARNLGDYFVAFNANRRMPYGRILEAWPALERNHPSVKFEVSQIELDEIFAKSNSTEMLMRMGGLGGVTTVELGDEVFATRFLPALVGSLMAYADRTKLRDQDVLASIGIEPECWLVGFA